jgi:hypothetical protein
MYPVRAMGWERVIALLRSQLDCSSPRAEFLKTNSGKWAVWQMCVVTLRKVLCRARGGRCAGRQMCGVSWCMWWIEWDYFDLGDWLLPSFGWWHKIFSHLYIQHWLRSSHISSPFPSSDWPNALKLPSKTEAFLFSHKGQLQPFSIIPTMWRVFILIVGEFIYCTAHKPKRRGAN